MFLFKQVTIFISKETLILKYKLNNEIRWFKPAIAVQVLRLLHFRREQEKRPICLKLYQRKSKYFNTSTREKRSINTATESQVAAAFYVVSRPFFFSSFGASGILLYCVIALSMPAKTNSSTALAASLILSATTGSCSGNQRPKT